MGCVGFLLGFNIGMMWACFHICGMSLLRHDLLRMSVNAFNARGPKCLRCMLEILSGPVACEFLRDLIVLVVSSVVNGGFDLSSCIFLFSLSIFLFCFCVGSWLIFEKCLIRMLQCCLGVEGWFLVVIKASWVEAGFLRAFWRFFISLNRWDELVLWLMFSTVLCHFFVRSVLVRSVMVLFRFCMDVIIS